MTSESGTVVAGETTTVPAARARAVRVRQGQRVVVADVAGGQVADLWALCDPEAREYLSTAHTRSALGRLFPRVGEQFLTNRRRPILLFVSDSSPGDHDALFAACSRERYEQLGAVSGHANCEDNFGAAAALAGLQPRHLPDPVNLFQRTPPQVSADGVELGYLPARSRPGDAVQFRAELDCWIVVSACAMDVLPLNGGTCTDITVTVAGALAESGGEEPR